VGRGEGREEMREESGKEKGEGRERGQEGRGKAEERGFGEGEEVDAVPSNTSKLGNKLFTKFSKDHWTDFFFGPTLNKFVFHGCSG
jgi:hypothetical protein